MSPLPALVGLAALLGLLHLLEARIRRRHRSPPLPGVVSGAVVFVTVLVSQELREAMLLEGWASVAAAAGMAACAHIAVSCVWAWRKAAECS